MVEWFATLTRVLLQVKGLQVSAQLKQPLLLSFLHAKNHLTTPKSQNATV